MMHKGTANKISCVQVHSISLVTRQRKCQLSVGLEDVFSS